MRYKLAILNALAKQPDGRATLDGIRREAELIIANLDPIQLKRFNALGELDIFQSRLVLQDQAGWQITPAGLALLGRLEDVTGLPLERCSAAAAMHIRRTQEIMQSEQSSEPFSAELRMRADVDRHIIADEHRIAAAEVRHRKLQNRSADRQHTKRFAVVQRAQELSRSLGAFVSAKKQSMSNSGSSRFGGRSSIKPMARSERSIRTIAGAAFALFVLLFAVASVLAAIAFGQIQSLKSDVTVLRRELLPLKERLATFEQAESQKRDQDQQKEAQDISETEKNKSGGEARDNQTTLELTREEIQLIRQYIKPAPLGEAAPEIKVGDPVGGAMIPLPSQLMEKIPKLQGAKFTTPGGSIIIVRSGSRQADAVLGPN